jgi:hypothetical protein
LRRTAARSADGWSSAHRALTWYTPGVAKPDNTSIGNVGATQ